MRAMPDTPNKPKLIVFSDGTLGFVPEPSPEDIAKRKRVSTKCGHVKRDLRRNKRLTGKTLEFALTVVGEDSEIGDKLKAGRALTEYERHLVIDVQLLHKRLSPL
ncbi:MAG: hypothetical protein QOF64_2842 [Candidatus Binatota bacterium]|jgi:hypothetical protein|nr:hypothetical protein [Candidatus Binatota bacterium]